MTSVVKKFFGSAKSVPQGNVPGDFCKNIYFWSYGQKTGFWSEIFGKKKRNIFGKKIEKFLRKKKIWGINFKKKIRKNLKKIKKKKIIIQSFGGLNK